MIPASRWSEPRSRRYSAMEASRLFRSIVVRASKSVTVADHSRREAFPRSKQKPLPPPSVVRISALFSSDQKLFIKSHLLQPLPCFITISSHQQLHPWSTLFIIEFTHHRPPSSTFVIVVLHRWSSSLIFIVNFHHHSRPTNFKYQSSLPHFLFTNKTTVGHHRETSRTVPPKSLTRRGQRVSIYPISFHLNFVRLSPCSTADINSKHSNVARVPTLALVCSTFSIAHLLQQLQVVSQQLTG